MTTPELTLECAAGKLTSFDAICGYVSQLERQLVNVRNLNTTLLSQLAEAQNTLSASLFQLEQARKDAERYRWLVEDHEDLAVRRTRNALAERIPMMSYSAANAAIDAALAGKEDGNG